MINSSRVYLDQFVQAAAGSVGEGALILDAGAGDGPYRRHFAHARYESADFGEAGMDYIDLTYRCELHSIPVENDRYELILLSQVLEHLPDPMRVLVELHRVLRPGGRLWLSAPLFYEEHLKPFDFYRYTQFGCRYLVEGAGFTIERLDWLEGYFGTLSYQLRNAVKFLPHRPENFGGGFRGLITAVGVAAMRPALGLLARVMASADLREKWTTSGHCKNYCVVARKVG